MNCSRMLAAIGLALDLSGALLLWKYGLPESLSRDGSINLICEQQDQAEVASTAVRPLGYCCFVLDLLGFCSPASGNFYLNHSHIQTPDRRVAADCRAG
jgi:hypothetical protein